MTSRLPDTPLPARLRIMLLTLVVNGQERAFGNLASPVTLADVVAAMNLKGDRVAVEHNGAIVQRAGWTDTPVASGDRLEVVHFVGGGRDVSSLWGD
jgi:sulfur carrier protein